MAYKRKIKGKDHYIFSDKKEFREKYPDEPIVNNWKEAEESQWCYSDDGQVVMVIKKGSFQGSGSDKRKVTYIRTLLGMVNINSNSTLTGAPAKNIYSFTKKTPYKEALEGQLSHGKRLFAKYVAAGMRPVDAYMKAYPDAKSKDYAMSRARVLLRSERVSEMVDKEIELLLSEVGITKRYLLEEAKAIVDKPDARDGDKLRSLETLMKISGLLTTEKKTDSIAMIQEFTGFSKDKLMAFEQGALPSKQKELSDGS